MEKGGFRLIEGLLSDYQIPRSPKSCKKQSVDPCKNCEIKGKIVLPTLASLNNPLIIVGAYPGAEEENQGKAFVGPSGEYLWKVLLSTGFSRSEIYLTNVLRCRPLDSKNKFRQPTDKEIENCGLFAKQEVEKLNPKLVVLCGEQAVKLFLKRKFASSIRGQVKVRGGQRFLITYNPAHIIREPENSIDRLHFEQDIKSAFEIFNDVKHAEDKDYKLIESYEQLDEILEKLSKGVVSVDFETYAPGEAKEKKALDPYAEGFKVLSVSLCGEPKKAYCVLIEHPDNKMNPEVVAKKLKTFLEDQKIPKIGQNCLHSGTTVVMANGSKRTIYDLVRKKSKDYVLSYNPITNTVESKQIINWFKAKDENVIWYRIVTEDSINGFWGIQSPRLTSDHKIYLKNKGMTRVDKVKSGDFWLCNKPDLNLSQYQIILGSTLGDGGLYLQKSSKAKNVLFSVYHSEKGRKVGTEQKSYIFWKQKVLANLVSSFKRTRGTPKFRKSGEEIWGWSLITKSLPCFTKLRKKLYKDGKKFISKNILEELTPLGIAIWFMDDGSSYLNSISIATEGFTKIEIETIIDFFDEKYGIKFKLKSEKDRSIWVGRRKGGEKFINLIAPYIIPSMVYKIPKNYNVKNLGSALKKVESERKIDFSFSKILEILPSIPTYDKHNRFCIEVEGNNNFFTSAGLVSNCKFDHKIIAVHFNIFMENIVFDTMLASSVLDSRKGIHNLDRLAMDWLNERSYKFEMYQIGSYIPKVEDLVERGCKDADYVYRLYPIMKQKLIEEQLYTYLMEQRIPAISALAKAEVFGLPIDVPYTIELTEKYEKEVEKSKAEILNDPYVKEIPDFNVNSNDQIATLLFEKYKFPVISKTSSSKPSTDKATFSQLSKQFPDYQILKSIQEYSDVEKFYGTYLLPMVTTHIKPDGRVHPTFNMHVTATGRLSSENPNAQNVPARGDRAKEIMNCYRAPDGYLIALADYCLHPDTEIECLNGKKKIKEVVNLVNEGKELWVYCYRFDKNRVGLQKVIAGAKTGENKEVWEVILDNGKRVVATPDHKFMKRNGEYEELKNLKIGDSLMPFYNIYDKNGTDKVVYRNILTNKSKYSKSYIPEHQLVAMDVLGYNSLKGFSVHHKDGCGINNLPENLEVLTQSDHFSFHRKNETLEIKKKAKRGAWTKTIEGKIKTTLLAKKQWNSLSEEEKIWMGSRISLSKIGKCLGKNNGNWKERIFWKCCYCGKEEFLVPYKAQRKFCNLECSNKAKKGVSIKCHSAWNKGLTKETDERVKRSGRPGHPNYYHGKKLINHKIISIMKCGYSDVYNITVKDCHNFVLSAGVVVKNSQIELRCLAQIAQDQVMLESLRNGEDLHQATANKMGKKIGRELSRHIGKGLNFGIVYGMTKYGLAEALKLYTYDKDGKINGFDTNLAQVYLDEYLKVYEGIREYQIHQIEFLKKHGYVLTAFGRKRWIYLTGNEKKDEEAYRKAGNSPIQGTASDINTMAFVKLIEIYDKEKFKSFPMSLIHDAIMFQIHEDEAKDLRELNVYVMENLPLPFLTDVKMKVDYSEGKTWMEAKGK